MPQTALELVRSPAEELAECERIIAASSQAFYDVGCAVQKIRDKRLYKEKNGGSFATFHAYCKGVWGWTRQYADYLIAAANVADHLTTMVVKDALTERVVRPLTKLKKPDETHPQTQVIDAEAVLGCFTQAQAHASTEGRKKVAARHVAAVVKEYLGEEQSWLIKPSDNWNFSPVFYGRIDGETGHGYIPGEVYANCLFYYTKPGDCVVDPMAGGEQIFRVYEDRFRWMRPEPWDLDIHGFDLTPRGPYADRIGQHDLRSGFPIPHADYIFLDVPYFGMVAGEYSDHAEDLANMPIDHWDVSITAIAYGCAQAQKADDLCTVVSPNFRDTTSGSIVLAPRLIQRAFELAGYQLHGIAYQSRRIQQQQAANMARMNTFARERRVMLTDMSEVLTFRRKG